MSFIRRMQIRRKFSLTLVFSNVGNFSSFDCWLAKRIPSKLRLTHSRIFARVCIYLVLVLIIGCVKILVEIVRFLEDGYV